MRVASGSPPVAPAPATGSGALPPLANNRGRGGSTLLSKLTHGLIRSGGGGSATSLPPAVAAECSDGPAVATVSRSAWSGSSSRAPPLPAGRSALASDFQWTLQSRDLPPDIRPIVEDNKMLQEEVRRYRQRAGEQEASLSAKERQLVALRDELQRERQRLRECSVSPGQLLQERQFRQMLQDRDSSIRQLEQKAGVLEKAKEAAERRLRNDLAAERRQQAGLKQQMRQLQEEMAEKAKQGRFNQLHINQLYRRLEPLEAAVAAAAAAPPPAVAAPVPAAPPVAAAEAEERVQLMLCVVYQGPSAAEIAAAAARLAAEEAAARQAALRLRQEPAARAIQAAFRGFLARRQLAAQQRAAVTIQAHVRGMLVRQALAPILEQRRAEAGRGEAALSPAERLAQRRQAAERQYRERTAAAKAKPQKRLPARPSIAATTRPGNTAPEAAARQRQRSLLSVAAEGAGSASPAAPGAGAGSSGAAAAAAGRAITRPSLGLLPRLPLLDPALAPPPVLAGKSPSTLEGSQGRVQGGPQPLAKQPLSTGFGSSKPRLSITEGVFH